MWWAAVLSFLKKYGLMIIGVIADILVVAFFIYAAWLIFHPKPTTSQSAETIYNNYYYPSHRVAGLSLTVPWLGDIGWVKYTYPDKPSSIQTTITGGKK